MPARSESPLPARHGAPRNALATVLKEYGAIRRTIYAAKYLSDPVYRRKIARQLNKGESLHTLRRQLHYAREGKVTRRQPEQRNAQAWCLTVVTNAVVCWRTTCLGLAVGELRGSGREVDAEVLAHISPARSSAVNYYGSIAVDYDRELAQLDDQGHRRRRTARLVCQQGSDLALWLDRGPFPH
ncbi:Tn3 family transposase [Streptomyces acidiscabies]|uniref:Tn3 family transposase n=1 Tax=Streptomyces acidiscabies TaxID=42234 RepID=UPI0022771AEB|nr:Tn3 family transposase [Streptomyces acidiscabies]